MNENANKIELAGTRTPQTLYDAAFKRSAVEHYHSHKRSITQTAQELGINRWTLREWIHPERAAAAPPAPARSLSCQGAYDHLVEVCFVSLRPSI